MLPKNKYAWIYWLNNIVTPLAVYVLPELRSSPDVFCPTNCAHRQLEKERLAYGLHIIAKICMLQQQPTEMW